MSLKSILHLRQETIGKFFAPRACVRIPYYAIVVYIIYFVFINYVMTKYGIYKGGDSDDYIAAASKFSQTFNIFDIISSQRGIANFSYCFVLGLFIATFGAENTLALYWFNLLIPLVTLVILMKIVKITLRKDIFVFLAGLLFAISHEVASWSCYTFLTDTFFMMILVWYTFTLYKVRQRESLFSLWYANIVFAILFFTKTTSLSLLPLHLVLITFFSQSSAKKRGAKPFFRIILVALLPVLLLIGVKLALKNMNKLEADQLHGIVTTYYKGYIFYEQLKHNKEDYFEKIFYDFHVYDEINEGTGRKSLFSFVLAYPGHALKLWTFRFYYYWKPFMKGFKNDMNKWNIATTFIPEIMAFLGIVLLLHSRKFDLIFWIPLFVMMLNCGFYCFSWLTYENRFLMPILPFVYFYATISIWQIYEMISPKISRYQTSLAVQTRAI